MLHTLAIGAATLAGAGMVQAALGAGLVRRFTRQPLAAQAATAVTLLKPLHGAEPLLAEALESCFRINHPCFQLVFGVQDPRDPAIGVVQALRARFPAVDVALVIDPTPHGINRKVANLINMLPAARHDTLVIADSDIHVTPDYLDSLLAALAQPGTGLVTTLYAGLPSTPGIVGQMGTAYIDQVFLPGALLARAMGRQDCLGATMALTRHTLRRIGGFEALSDHLADDAVLGHLVAATGQRVALATTIPATTVPERALPRLFEHELRWARTIRHLEPVGFVLSVVQYPLFWAALALAASGGAPWACAVFAACWVGRWAVGAMLGRALRRATPARALASRVPFWLLPLRDIMSITVILASYRTSRVSWRGQVLRATPPRLAVDRALAGD
jgi:ceramide glucosyltransferase